MAFSSHLEPEEQIVLLSADIHPGKAVLERIDHLLTLVCDWDFFAKTVMDNAASSLFCKNLPNLLNGASIPSEVLSKLKQASLRILCRNMLLIHHFRQVITAFSEEHIPVIVLKGAFLSDWLYGDLALRKFCDLDLLVSPEDGPRCQKILKQMGYSSNDLRFSEFVSERMAFVHYAPLIKKGVSVELHLRIHSQLESYQVDLNGMWSRALPFQMHGVDALGFSANDLLVHLCLHADKHMVNGSIQFTCFYDLANLLNHKAELLDWDRLEQQCEAYHAVDSVYKYLLLAHQYLNACLPESFLKKHGNRLKTRDFRQFEGMLKGKYKKNNFSFLVRSFKQMHKPNETIRFFFELSFPGKEYMKERYSISNQWQLPFYYMYRFFYSFRNVWYQFMNELH